MTQDRLKKGLCVQQYIQRLKESMLLLLEVHDAKVEIERLNHTKKFQSYFEDPDIPKCDM